LAHPYRPRNEIWYRFAFSKIFGLKPGIVVSLHLAFFVHIIKLPVVCVDLRSTPYRSIVLKYDDEMDSSDKLRMTAGSMLGNQRAHRTYPE
jgi:hypothetical protein